MEDRYDKDYKENKLSIDKFGDNILDLLEETYIELYPEYFEDM